MREFHKEVKWGYHTRPHLKKFQDKFHSRNYEAMTFFFGDINSFRSWLDQKTDAELKSKLYRADPRARLNGSKPDLVRRLVESTRNLDMERQGTIFPELRRRRRQEHLVRSSQVPARIAAPIHAVQAGQAAARDHHHGQTSSGPRNIPRAQATRSAAITSSRPVPIFNTYRPFTPTVPNIHRTDSRAPRALQSEARDVTPLRAGFRNPRTIFPGVTGHAAEVSTPEQILRETLEVHAGLIIQSISQAATPRLRQNSMSRVGDAAANPVPSKLRAASTSSAEKRGPEVLLEDAKYQVKLECKICFDSTVNTVLLPCGHACCCQDCSVRLKFATWDSKCPICRNKIQSISMLYFS